MCLCLFIGITSHLNYMSCRKIPLNYKKYIYEYKHVFEDRMQLFTEKIKMFIYFKSSFHSYLILFDIY